MEQIIYLVSLAIIFLIGMIAVIISNFLRMPRIILLLLAGAGLNMAAEKFGLFNLFPDKEALLAISVFSIVLVLFVYTNKVKVEHLDTNMQYSSRIAAISSVLTLILLSFFTSTLLGTGMIFPLFFSIMMLSSQYADLSGIKSSPKEILENESGLSTVIAVLVFFAAYMLIFSGNSILSSIADILLSMGIGVLVSIIFFDVIARRCRGKQIAFFIAFALVIAYAGAELVGGVGVFGVFPFALFFANTHLKRSDEHMRFFNKASGILEVMAFVLIGIIAGGISISFALIWKSILLFSILLSLRYISVIIVLAHSSFTEKEKLFIALYSPKGLLAAALILFFALNTHLTSITMSLLLLFLIYSAATASTAQKLKKRFFAKTFI